MSNTTNGGENSVDIKDITANISNYGTLIETYCNEKLQENGIMLSTTVCLLLLILLMSIVKIPFFMALAALALLTWKAVQHCTSETKQTNQV